MAAATNTGGGGGSQVALIANTDPQNITFKSVVQLSTVDQNNNNAPIIEGYIVSGPSSPGTTPLNLSGYKIIVPLTTSSSQGSPCLKIHLPTSTNGLNKVYVTYCVVNQYMIDGYYDYTTGVPATYMSALRNWINTNPQTGQPYTNNAPILRTRSLKFTGYGDLTNKPANSVTFYINFQGTFSNAVFGGGTEVLLGGGSLGTATLGGGGF